MQLAGAGWTDHDLVTIRTSYDLAASLFAGAERGSGKPFIDHLIGCASCALLGGAAPAVVAAAVLHAAYDQGDFGDGCTGATRAHRRRVQDAVGREVEALVHGYETFAWGPADAAAAGAALDRASVATRAVLLVRVANEIDDALDAGLVVSGKATSPTGRVPAGTVVGLAEQLGPPSFADLARRTLLADAVALPDVLVIGNVGSRRRLPASARTRHRTVARRQVRRVGRALVRRVTPRANPNGRRR